MLLLHVLPPKFVTLKDAVTGAPQRGLMFKSTVSGPALASFADSAQLRAAIVDGDRTTLEASVAQPDATANAVETTPKLILRTAGDTRSDCPRQRSRAR
jgi:hypothetical protein